MRENIESILGSKGIVYFNLPVSARLLLVTDGTVTELLEALVREPIKLGLKKQTTDELCKHPDFEVAADNQPCLHRCITLRGKTTSVDWLYAESIILHGLLSPKAQSMLIDDEIPIGTILNCENTDNHRKIVDCGMKSNKIAANHLGIESNYPFVYRIYQIIVGEDPLMQITEWFPIDRINDVISSKTT